MRINKLYLLGSIFVALFFGYLGYIALVQDRSETAETEIRQQLKSEQAQDAKQFGLKRGALALREYRKNIVEQPAGCNCGPAIDNYTEGHRAPWAPMFASWVAKEAGTPMYNNRTGSWRFDNSRAIADYLEKNGSWYYREQVLQKNLRPQVGDFVIFWRGEYEENLGHVDIVTDIGENETVGLVGGNIADKIEYREDFPYLQHHGFLGFGRPNPPAATPPGGMTL